MQQFDLLNSPLEGTNLIEASAGTGKTYTIAGLFLRLLLEKELSVDQILVVTFTEAATGELQERIRDKLRETLEAFTGGESDDCFVNELVRKTGGSARAARCLKEALQDFDLASIFTIHGFCLRMLHENAFESGTLFDTELITDQEHIKRQIIEDFWRKSFYTSGPLFVNYAIDNSFTPSRLGALVGKQLAQPQLKIIPLTTSSDPSQKELEYRERFNEVREAWQSAQAQVEDILTRYEGLDRNKYRKTSIPAWILAMEQYLVSGENNATLFQGFEKFTASQLEASVKGGYSPPTHPFFNLCEKLKAAQEDLLEIFEQRFLELRVELCQHLRRELARRKEKKNVESFDDLLVKLDRALSGKGGDVLAGVVRSKFKAALIDEFQDTDPIQYCIFRKVFTEAGSTLFLIGDPKQAIYGFRGADIFAYMDAASQVGQRYTLGENWRSVPDLITAINTIFADVERPFVYRDIEYHLKRPAERQDAEILDLEGESRQPLHLWVLDVGRIAAPGKAMPKGQARELIARGVAAEISRLVGLSRKNRAFLGAKPLRESDIAVLVRRNKEALLMQKALSTLNISSVLYSTASLFDSCETIEVQRVMAAIAEPNNEKLLKAAMVTDMIGISGEELARLIEDEAAWDKWLVTFRDFHDLWNNRGFMLMFRHLLSKLDVLPRLMTFPDGERRNTNMLHLLEVLHQVSTDRKLGMSGLVKWLPEQRFADRRWTEECQLRLESDESAVKLVTIHKSKGLEYPIVFCPFTWDGSRLTSPKDPFMFHDAEDNMRLTLDLGSADKDKHRVLAEQELLAENLRLLYVALTRARNRCYLVWGRFNQGETAAPAYVFHNRGPKTQENVVDAIAGRFTGLSNEDLLRDLRGVQARANGTIKISEMPVGPGEYCIPLPGAEPHLSCRRFSGNIDRRWQISSFSALVSGKAHQSESGDRDAIILDHMNPVAAISDEEEVTGIFAFPRGAQAGTFLHHVLERLDFAERDGPAMEDLVAEKLKEYGFESAWKETLCAAIRRVLAVPLVTASDGFTLSCIEKKDRLNELEFYFPLKSISAKTLRRLFAKHAAPDVRTKFPERIERLEFAPVKGFMKGFIDMVFQFEDRFYIVDWKSNYLGCRADDYGQEELAAAMVREFYVLQYHIYSLALNQYLGSRLPGYEYKTHFGGVFYIFLRGVDPEKGPDYGIYRDKPAPELIQALREHLLDHERA